MTRIPDAMLAELHPRVTAWVEAQERLILEQGEGLDESEMRIASQAGVLKPERVRLLAVAQVPLPQEGTLRRAAQAFGFVSEMTDGLTVGYGFFVRKSRRKDPALVAHELVHSTNGTAASKAFWQSIWRKLTTTATTQPHWNSKPLPSRRAASGDPRRNGKM